MVATVIHYCTNDFRFLRKLIEEARLFSDKIIIPVATHFFNGKSERFDLLHQTYQEFSDCTFLEYIYYPDHLYNPCLSSYSVDDPEWGCLWNSTSRYLATLFMPAEIEYALFLDSDEIVDGKRFAEWLKQGDYHNYSAVRIGCYYYTHHASLRADRILPSGLFIRLKELDLSSIVNSRDRWGWWEQIPEPKKMLLDDPPYIHHYSWVRTKEECLFKTNSWGHRFDRDWPPLIEAMFRDPKNCSDLLELGLVFEEAEVYFDPLATPENVIKINAEMAQRKEISKALQEPCDNPVPE